MSTPNLSGLPTLAYARRSTTKQDTSIDDQLSWGKSKAAALGLDLVAGWFTDDGIAGSVTNRPGYEEMKTFLAGERRDQRKRPKKGTAVAEVLLCWDLDRLSRRDLTDAQAELSILRRSGIRWIVTETQTWDLRNAFDRVMMAMQQELGKRAYSASIAANVARRAREKATLGLWVSGLPPYGYRVGKESGKLEKAPATATVFRGIVNDLMTGRSLGEVAFDLNERHVPGPGRTGQWRRDSLHNMIHDRVYTGLFEWPKTHQGKYVHVGKDGSSAVADGDDERCMMASDPAERIVIEDNHPALLSVEEREAILAALAGRRWKRTTPYIGGGEWVLSGLAFCGACKERHPEKEACQPLHGRTERHRRGEKSYVYRRLFCPANGKSGAGTCTYKGALQDAVVATLADEIPRWFESPDRRAELVTQLEGRSTVWQDDHAKELDRLDHSIADLDERIARGQGNLLLISVDLRPGCEARLRQWSEERDALVRKRQETTRAGSMQVSQVDAVRRAMDALGSLKKRITKAKPAALRRLFETMVTKVIVHFGAHEDGSPELEIVFRPELGNLLSSGATRRC